MRFVHSRDVSLYEAANEWLDSFGDSEDDTETEFDDSESLDSTLGAGYFCDSVSSQSDYVSQPHAGTQLARYSIFIDFTVSKTRMSSMSRNSRPEPLSIMKKEVVDKRMSGDVCNFNPKI